jgi:5-methyltetrahydrofolate--homocysteine methyltransferase
MNLLGRISAGEILVADGAMGTMLMERGLPSGAPPESINRERPDLLEEIARLYREAGADLVQTNTFGASPLKLALFSLEDETEEINRSAVRAARRGAGGAYVVGSCGPTGRLLEPYGDVDPARVADGFRRQIAALASEGVDMVVVETMTDVREATLAVRAAKEISSSLPVAATMTFDPTPKGFFTIMGVSVPEAAEKLAEAGADMVGSNCGNGMEKMIAIAREFRAATKLPLLFQANAGLPETRDGALIYPESPDFFGRQAADLFDAGASIVGGCCGSTPAHIAALRRTADARQPNP